MLESKVNLFVEEYLSYSDPEKNEPKYFHDPIWGTIEVRAHEVGILDTPLLQRLRQIHQTGAVYQTFSSAHHTRFDHTIGVMHIASRMAEALRRKYPKLIDEQTIQKVRLAALLHDTGHSAFSHTSEEFFSGCSDIQHFKKKNERFANSGEGEILSYLIASSEAFAAFFNKLKAIYPEDISVSPADFAPLITGKPSDPKRLFEADIISGPFDADKLDYFPRDGRAAGVQLALDFERLLHCMELAEVEDLKGNTTHTLSIHRGGLNPIQQLLFSRASLFATVYHHHKVRACDSMIKGCFEHFRNTKQPFKKNLAFPGVKLDEASSFLYITDVDFFAEAGNHQRSSYEHQFIHSLLYRRLFKRIITISPRTIVNFNEDKGEEQQGAYLKFLALRTNHKKLRVLASRILKKSKCTARPNEVWLDLPSTPSLDKAGHARIRIGERTDNGGLVKLSAFIPVQEWMATYDKYSSQSYLFGPQDPEMRASIAEAAIEVFETEFGLTLKVTAIAKDIRSKVIQSRKSARTRRKAA